MREVADSSGLGIRLILVFDSIESRDLSRERYLTHLSQVI